MHEETAIISSQDVCHVLRNTYTRCKAYLEGGSEHFEKLLCHKVSRTASVIL